MTPPVNHHKCQETRPACGHCVKSGLNCDYPVAPQVVHQVSRQTLPNGKPPSRLTWDKPRQQVPIFTLQDMRFFQHFLLSCFPSHPIGNESIWTHEIPCLSQEVGTERRELTPRRLLIGSQYEYLMHAILGMAASDLMSQDRTLVTFAMSHRLKAIKSIKETLTETPKTNAFEQGNALMATCFALTFQSVALDDGMTEYMTFVRGVVIVAIQMYCRGAKFIFRNWIGDDQLNVLRPFMEKLAPTKRDWTDMALAGLRALEPLCRHPVERECYKLLTSMAEALYTSPFLGMRRTPYLPHLTSHH
jgi:hypothetical protein